MLVRFWANHHLLDLFQRPLWRVVKGRSRSYVDRIIAGASFLPLVASAMSFVVPRGVAVASHSNGQPAINAAC